MKTDRERAKKKTWLYLAIAAVLIVLTLIALPTAKLRYTVIIVLMSATLLAIGIEFLRILRKPKDPFA